MNSVRTYEMIFAVMSYEAGINRSTTIVCCFRICNVYFQLRYTIYTNV